MSSLVIRPCISADLDSVTEIYAHHVRHGTGTFELDAPDRTEITRRYDDVVAKSLPWLIAEREGMVVGFAYANHFRPRPAYRFCVEDSIYVHPQATGLGAGRLLLAELIARCESAGMRQMLAVIGDADNQGSIRLHERCGFEPCGVFKAAGWKFERWLDVILMQRALGVGDRLSPVAL